MGRGVCFCAAAAGLYIPGLNIQKRLIYIPLRRDKVFLKKRVHSTVLIIQYLKHRPGL